MVVIFEEKEKEEEESSSRAIDNGIRGEATDLGLALLTVRWEVG